MPTYDVAHAHQGALLANYGTITRITCSTPPPPGAPAPQNPDPATGISSERYFSLIDDSGPTTRPRTLYSLDPFVQVLHPGKVMLSNSNGLPFTNLRVGSCPVGSQWRIETL
jgi:hypothetical protein